jgi:uncharacterized protein (UPF0305 family)
MRWTDGIHPHLDGIIEKLMRQIFERINTIFKKTVANIHYQEKMAECVKL